MKPVKGEALVNFDRGGVAINRAGTKVWLTFFSRLNRIIVEIPVPYYLFHGQNKKEILSMIGTGWSSACEFCSEKSFSRRENDKIIEIYGKIKELLEI